MKDKFDITKKIKEHETKYTIVLAVLFLFILLLSGYFILSIDNNELKKIDKSINYKYSSLSSTYKVVTLTNKNIVNANKSIIHISNTTDDKYYYRIVLQKDEETTKRSGSINYINDYKYIKYSINNKEELDLKEDMVIYEGLLKKNEEKDIIVNIWLKDFVDTNYQYHGYFSVEQKNQD